jgi:broad specificity phosphatase PhoE
MSAETVILARHGESVFSVRGAVNGDPRVAGGLTDLGQEQARALGEALAERELDLCVHTEFERVRETADLALIGRDVPRLVLAELNDIGFGAYEGGTLAEYRAWAWSEPPTAAPPGGESRAAIVERYVRGYRTVLSRPERTILVVAHGLPIRYVLDAAAGVDPGPRVEQVAYAEPFEFSAAELARAVERLDAWTAAPAWPS